MKQIKLYRFQYNTGELSMIIRDSRETIYACADLLSKNKKKYPVAVFIFYPEGKVKTGQA